MAQTPDVKITVVGNARVGKTALLMAYTVRKPTHRRWPVCDWFVPACASMHSFRQRADVGAMLSLRRTSARTRVVSIMHLCFRGCSGTHSLVPRQTGVFPVEYLPTQLDREVFPATYRGGTIDVEVVDVCDNEYHGTCLHPVRDAMPPPLTHRRSPEAGLLLVNHSVSDLLRRHTAQNL